MSPGRIAFIIVLLFGGAFIALGAIVLTHILPDERELSIGFGSVMIGIGCVTIGSLFRKPKPKLAPRDHPPGRTEYRDDGGWVRTACLVMGTVLLIFSVPSIRQPIVLILAVPGVGLLVAAGYLIVQQIRFGRARLKLAAPAYRGETLQGTITASGPGWAKAGRVTNPRIRLSAIRSGSRSSVTLSSNSVAATNAMIDGDVLTITFTNSIANIDDNERVSWNVQLTTDRPKHRVTFVVDVR